MKHYAQNIQKGPDFWLWLFVMAVLLTYSAIAFSQPCNYQTIVQTPIGDTVCCDTGQPSGAASNPVLFPGETNFFSLDATRPDISQAFISTIGSAYGAFIREDYLRPDGLFQHGFRIILCPPEPQVEPCFEEIDYPLNFTVNTSEGYGQLTINWYRGNPRVLVVGCQGSICRKLKRTILSNDTYIPFVGDFDSFQVWWNDCQFSTLNF